MVRRGKVDGELERRRKGQEKGGRRICPRGTKKFLWTDMGHR